MLSKLLSRLTYANVIATLALLLSLTGTAYAAGLPFNSVGTRHLKNGAVTETKVKNFALRLHDLGGRTNAGTRTVSTTINVPDGGCLGQPLTLFNPAPKGVIGSLVVGYLTDAQGNAAIDNNGAVVPTVISETSQGGAIANLIVCDVRGGGQTVPAGSVFHFRLIGP
jgi:hypothetical protein